MTNPHCRIKRVKFKRKSRYRSPAAFDLTTSMLVRARQTEKARGRG